MSQIVNPDPFSNPTVVSNREFPWIFDVYFGLQDDPLSDFCPKKSEKHSLQRIGKRKGSIEKQNIHNIPQASFCHRARMVKRVVKLLEVSFFHVSD